MKKPAEAGFFMSGTDPGETYLSPWMCPFSVLSLVGRLEK